jgi:hypothetical protein
MDNEELLNKIKIYEQRILYLEKELNETKEHLKKYTAPSYKKVYYENNKEEIKEKVKEYKQTNKYNPSPEQKKKWARTAYLKKKEKLEKEKIETQNI